MERFQQSTADVANMTSIFLEEWGAELATARSEHGPYFGTALDELVRAVEGREEAQEAFLRSVAGR